MKKAYVLVDIGGNSKVAVFGIDGEKLALKSMLTKYDSDPDFAFGGMSFDAPQMADRICELIRETLAEAGPVEVLAVSSSSQREGIVLIGHEGEPVVGYPNSDIRGMEWMGDVDWDRIAQLTTLDPSPIYSVLKYVGTKNRQPEVAARTATFTSISDWVGQLFTGKAVWEHSQAIHSLVYDIHKREWSQELCDMFEIDMGILPPLADAGQVLGGIRPEIAAATGIPESAVFVVGGADTQTAIFGSNAGLGDTVLVAGSTNPLVRLDEDTERPDGWIGWVSPHIFPNQYMKEVNTGCLGINLQIFKERFFPDTPYEELERMAAERGIPACTAVFAMSTHIPDDLVLAGAFFLDNPIRADVEPVDYYHALILNNAFYMGIGLKELAISTDTGKGYVIGCAGGFNSRLSAQALADVSGLEVRVYEQSDSATMIGCLNLCNRALDLPEFVPALKFAATPAPSDDLNDYYDNWLSKREVIKNS